MKLRAFESPTVMIMEPLPFYVLPRVEIERVVKLPTHIIANYESLRPDILQDAHVDVFCQNSRSATQRWTSFELFERISAPAENTPIVCMSWLELCADQPHSMLMLIAHLRQKYPTNPKVLSWNHDTDAASVPVFDHMDDTFTIVNFNTSRPRKIDLLVPFWNIDTQVFWKKDDERPIRGSFYGLVPNRGPRRPMLNEFRNREGWYVSEERLAKNAYLEVLKRSQFALCPRGGGLSSYRLYEAIQCGAIPMLFADDYVLPFPHLPWGDMVVRIPEIKAGIFDACIHLISGLNTDKMRRTLASVRSDLSLAAVQRAIYDRLAMNRLKPIDRVP